jgi:hypothetical protein
MIKRLIAQEAERATTFSRVDLGSDGGILRQINKAERIIDGGAGFSRMPYFGRNSGVFALCLSSPFSLSH